MSPRFMKPQISRFSWDMLGFGMCRTSYLFCFVFTAATACIVPNALITYWLFATFAAVVISVLALRFASGASHFPKFHDRALACGAAASLGGILAMTYGNYAGLFPLALAGVIASGCGCALVFILWGCKLSRLPENQIVFYVVVGMAIAGCIMLAVNSLGDFSGTSALIFAIIALFTLRDEPLPTEATGAAAHAEADEAARTKDPTETTASTGVANPMEMAPAVPPKAVSHAPFLKLCMMMFIVPFAYHLAVMTFISTTILNRDIEGVIVAGLSLVIIFLARKIKVIDIFRVVLPVIIGAYLFMQLLPAQFAPFCTIVAGSGLKLSEVFIWILLISNAHDNPGRRWPVIGWGVAAMFAGRSVAFLLASLLMSFEGYSPTLVVYLLVVILVIAVLLILPEAQGHGGQGTRHGVGDDDGSGSESAPSAATSSGSARIATLSNVCDKIAHEHGLTRREAEILQLLAQGRSQGIIADKLSITEGTAHVHITHIYQKLDVHGQQEIITMVEKLADNDDLPER